MLDAPAQSLMQKLNYQFPPCLCNAQRSKLKWSMVSARLLILAAQLQCLTLCSRPNSQGTIVKCFDAKCPGSVLTAATQLDAECQNA
jgi:hypothetical protein